MARKIPLLVALLALVLPASAAAYVPSGFIGVSPQGPTNRPDFELMRKAGVEQVRVPLNWVAVQPQPPSLAEPDWDGFDHFVRQAAAEGIRVMPFVLSTPEWVAPRALALPVRSAFQRGAWAAFLREAVERYGPEGEFWEEERSLEYLPIERWEIWNEQNIVSFADDPSPAAYAKLIRISGRTIHRADPAAKVLLGGLFGRPLQIPPNVASGDYLARVYKAGNVKPYFDGVALHPYVADAGAIRGQIVNLRRIMRAFGDSRTRLFVTELGWGSRSGPSRWERGLEGQANQLSRAFAMLAANRFQWRIGGVWWFTWSDEGGECAFCGSAGLLTADRKAKPSWYRFVAWTGGDPDAAEPVGSDSDG